MCLHQHHAFLLAADKDSPQGIGTHFEFNLALQRCYPFNVHDSLSDTGHGATISAPHMHGMCLELLKDNLKPVSSPVFRSSLCDASTLQGAKALDVGSGSGYLTACMAHMVGEKGHVYGELNGESLVFSVLDQFCHYCAGVEHIPELVEFSLKNLKADNEKIMDRIVSVCCNDLNCSILFCFAQTIKATDGCAAICCQLPQFVFQSAWIRGRSAVRCHSRWCALDSLLEHSLINWRF